MLIFFFFLAASRGLWDLSSPTRDLTQAPAVRAPSPNPWTAREFSRCCFNISEFIVLVRPGTWLHEKYKQQ